MNRLFIILIAFVCCGSSCPVKPQKGGHVHGELTPVGQFAEAFQPDNPNEPASQSQESTEETSFILPAGSEMSERTTTQVSSNAPPVTRETSYRTSEPMPVKKKVERRLEAKTGSAQKDTARELVARFSAMKPVQWTGITLCLASIAAFYFGWPSLGLMALAVGVGMIVTAAVLPGHELLILSVGGIGLSIAAMLVVYGYKSGHLDANKNGIPDFLESKPK